MVMVLLPTLRAIAPDALPLATVVPFTVIDAVASAAVGVTVIDEVAFETDAVYDVVADANTGVSVPALKVKLERLLLFDETGAALVTVTV